jgi:hypothetical protein
MAQCEGTTRSGERCKLDAQAGSRFCHLHGAKSEEEVPSGGEAAEEAVEWGDLVPLLVAGAMAAGLLFFLRSFGKWIPRL